MKTFYFSGLVKDLPLALLKRANEDLHEQNKKVKFLFDTNFVATLVRAAKEGNSERGRSAMRHLLRPKI